MSTIIFRTALLTDLPSIVALLADDELGSQRESLSPVLGEGYLTAFKAIEADPNQRLIVVVDGEIIVGTMQLSFIPSISRMGAWRGQVEGVRIARPLRHSGLGLQMLKWALAEFKSRGCKVIQLTTDKSRSDAHRFYEKLGFVASHEGYKLIL